MTITGEARLAGVIGWPIGHSRSPRLHGYWLEQHGIDGAYVPLPVHPEHFERVLRSLPLMGFVGANVTVPHKEVALRAVDEVDEQAWRIGAVNTIVVRPDGSLEGRNTDAFGFHANLRAGAPDWRAEDAPVVVLGAGGAARAVCLALVEAGVPEIRVLNRTRERAQALADEIGGPFIVPPWGERSDALADAGLLVNGTILGMHGADVLTIDLTPLPQNAVVNDIVYVPLETPLLRQARLRGNVVIDGVGMLLHQARPAFEAWFGVMPEVTAELRTFVLEP